MGFQYQMSATGRLGQHEHSSDVQQAPFLTDSTDTSPAQLQDCDG